MTNINQTFEHIVVIASPWSRFSPIPRLRLVFPNWHPFELTDLNIIVKTVKTSIKNYIFSIATATLLFSKAGATYPSWLFTNFWAQLGASDGNQLSFGPSTPLLLESSLKFLEKLLFHLQIILRLYTCCTFHTKNHVNMMDSGNCGPRPQNSFYFPSLHPNYIAFIF